MLSKGNFFLFLIPNRFFFLLTRSYFDMEFYRFNSLKHVCNIKKSISVRSLIKQTHYICQPYLNQFQRKISWFSAAAFFYCIFCRYFFYSTILPKQNTRTILLLPPAFSFMHGVLPPLFLLLPAQ